jgi:type I restriction-modification system DNA methylase subunit
MNSFPDIRIEGGLLGPDVLDQLLAGELPGQRPADFGLDSRRSLTDEIAAVFADARALWGVFQRRLERTPDDDPGTSVTRDAWVMPFLGLLDYKLERNQRAYDIDGLTFAISHRAGESADAPPVHIVGARQELGRVAPSGRPRLAPHSLLQEYLNRTEYLWGIVTNGLTVRLLRNSTFIRKQAYIEFNLQTILDEQHFQDFAVLYRLLHRTRFPRTVADAEDCFLEQYYRQSLEQGGRVRERLRDGVKACLEGLANGFLQHPANSELRERVLEHSAALHLTPAELYRELLRIVYRFLFLLVSEERGLVSADPIYREHYGIARLRRLVESRAAYTHHDDIWQSLRVLWKVLSSEELAEIFNAAPLNGELFAPLVLDGYSISNRALLEAFWNLAWYQESSSGPPRRVNYAALDVEELGSVYESLLEYHPQVDASGGAPRFELAPGSERRETGSYYTPPELVAELIHSALDPVIEERLQPAKTQAEKEAAILSIRVCDPAAGSGHFLLAAARRLGKELARIRTGEDEPAPERVREAIRDVVAHCIYGVDKNPLAVELCRVALWLEAHAEGRPLAFLDRHIRLGDSLVGVADPETLREGIPDGAFKPVSGDDRAVAREAKWRNTVEREASLFHGSFKESLARLAEPLRRLEDMPEDTLEQVRQKAEASRRAEQSDEFQRLRLACDAWTAAFFQKYPNGAGGAVTTQALHDALSRGHVPDARLAGFVQSTSHKFRFFHWPLAFPEVFASGGFDVVLGNPPWERIKLQEEEFFATRDAEIARAPNKAARRKLIEQLPDQNPLLAREFAEAKHAAESGSKFAREGGRFPLTSRGDINTYALFAELARWLMNPHGRAGVIVPTGIATDDTCKAFFGSLNEKRHLASLFDFENREGLFPAIDSRMKFSLLTMTARPVACAEFAFFLTRAGQLRETGRRFSLSPEDLTLLNPNTQTCPVFRTRADAELTKKIYQRVPVLVNERTGENPWGIQFLRMLDMANDSHLFRTAPGEGLLPLYEAKMLHLFDHRWATYDGGETRDCTLDEKRDPCFTVRPRYWVPAREVDSRLEKWDREGTELLWRWERARREPSHMLSYQRKCPRVRLCSQAEDRGHVSRLLHFETATRSTPRPVQGFRHRIHGSAGFGTRLHGLGHQAFCRRPLARF